MLPILGSRVKMINDFGWVILDINQVEPRDTGEWTCRAYNAMGEARSSGQIRCVGKDNIGNKSIILEVSKQKPSINYRGFKSDYFPDRKTRGFYMATKNV